MELEYLFIYSLGVFLSFDLTFHSNVTFHFLFSFVEIQNQRCEKNPSCFWQRQTPYLLIQSAYSVMYVYSVQYCHKCVYKHMSCLVYVVIIITFAVNISMIISWVWLLTVELASSICGCQKMIFAICIKNEIVELSSVYGHHNHLCNNYSAWN